MPKWHISRQNQVSIMTTTPLSELPLVIIACQVFQDMLHIFLPKEKAEEVIYKDYGLHRVPKKISQVLQETIDGIDEPSLIALGYGLCGNGLTGLRAGKHTLLIPCVDDCIAMLLGSHGAYLREFETNPGTYYLSKGWLESGSHPLKEYREIIEKYGEENADWIMDQQYQNYNRIALVAHNEEDLDEYRGKAQEVARFCQRWNMRYEEILGSDNYVKRLVNVALNPNGVNEDFVLVPPGGEVKAEQFLR